MADPTTLPMSPITGDLSPALGMTIATIAVGAIATAATDVWQFLLQAIGVPPANWGLIGRWVVGFSRGVFVHRTIAAAPKVRSEVAIGRVFHYVVGIAYAALYLAIMSLGFGSGPTLGSALVFAIALLIAPWFVMQPALGLGFMAARTPKPVAVRIINVSVHAVFGLGLYLGAVAILSGVA
ncbi:MAG TPA: DUF2938 family protein [Stellaceae bacterium]|nr:DUF2938 family protein [Stellaceae bacterium]